MNLKIGGNDISLEYTWRAMRDIEKNVCKIEKISERLDDDDRLDVLSGIMLILINSGLKAEGKDTVDMAWLEDHLVPSELGNYTRAIIMTIAEGMKNEKKVGDPHKPRDLVLEEIEKKEGTDN